MLIPQIEEIKAMVKEFNLPVIVEGKRDKKALSKLGISNIFDISGKSSEKIIEKFISINPDAVVILTDFDKEGKTQFKILSKLFQSYGIKVDNHLRKRIRHIFGIQRIEEINGFIKIIENRS